MTVRYEGNPDPIARRGAEDCGIVIVKQNPRMADVSILEASRASLSWASRRDRNCTRGWIMKEFQRKDSSKLSMSKVDASADLGC